MLFGLLKDERDVAFFGKKAKFAHQHLDHFVDIDVRNVHFHPAVLYLPEVENLVYEHQHLAGVTVNEVDIFLTFTAQLFL